MNSNKCPYLKKECEELYNPDKCLNNYQKCWEYGRLTFVKNQSGQLNIRKNISGSDQPSQDMKLANNSAHANFYDSQVKPFEETEIFGSLEEKTISGGKICSEKPK